MSISDDALQDLVRHLTTRPGHETVRVHLSRLLIDSLGADTTTVTHEQRIEARSRVDTLLGDTVFELKSDLRREVDDAEHQLKRYLENRERETNRRFTGVATDGLDFRAYEMRDGDLQPLNQFRSRAEAPHDLLVWLESVVSVAPELPVDSLTVTRELGRDSTAYGRAAGMLAKAWRQLDGDPEAQLKRQLWTDLLAIVYGSQQDAEALWFQHSYLTIVAKAFAFSVLNIPPSGPDDLLSGRSLAEAGIQGGIESDFFDWIIKAAVGRQLVNDLVRRVGRFRIGDVGLDVLKVLYESLIDPEQRHDLGEYYTPDWLAARMCEAAIDDPLEQRVLDPACGSGTFLFHAIRRFIATARASEMPPQQMADRCAQQIAGIDIHPVAVIIARVTYLLALGTEVLSNRRDDLSIPVYLGDALQWSVSPMMGQEQVEIAVPAPPQGGSRAVLRFPVVVAEDPALFNSVIATMLEASEQDATASAVQATMRRDTQLSETEIKELTKTFETLRDLRQAGRNHVWGYVARNITRPVWLSRRAGRVDRVIGNPPWLSFRYRSDAMQTKARTGMNFYKIWVGGKLATHQDLSGYFFARCADLYMNQGGRIAFVMPLAAMTRGQFEKFRSGYFREAKVSFTAAWTFDERVFPLFPVPSCALFAERTLFNGRIPSRVLGFAGILAHRNATPEEAAARLLVAEEDAPSEANFQAATPYRKAFRQGATLVPRMLCYVQRRQTGRIGLGSRIPIESRRSAQEKQPWKDLPALNGAVEKQFLRPALLGESIAPFRILDWPEAVIPVDGEALDATGAAVRGYPGLSAWLSEAERLWNGHSNQRLTLRERLNYWGELVAQFPVAPLRVVYSASGTLPAAVVLEQAEAVTEHKLYWSAVASKNEANYLCAILNSETSRAAVEAIQSKGQWGARDFDKVMFTLPLPRFKADDSLHAELADAAARAEVIAASIELYEGIAFIRARQAIRAALMEDGIAACMDRLVARLLFHDESAVIPSAVVS